MSSKSKDTYYFSHDCNARRDPKIIALRSVYGAEGYGWWWILLEILREQEDYQIDISRKFAYSSLATEFGITREKCIEFIQACIDDFELLATDDTYIYSESMRRRMEMANEKRKKLSERGKRGADATNQKKVGKPAQATETPGTSEENCRLSDGTSEKKAGNERKGKEIKGNERKVKEDVEGGNEPFAASAAPPHGANDEPDMKALEKKQKAMTERMAVFRTECHAWVAVYGQDMLKEFYDYWREANKSKTKMKWELERTWSLKGRLETWAKNSLKWDKKTATNEQQLSAETTAAIQAQRYATIEEKYGAAIG